MKHEINKIQSKYHITGLHRIIKIYLLCYNNKKYILKEEYCRLSRFHKSTR